MSPSDISERITMASEAESLSRQAYRRLETLIVTMKLPPGALVTEKQLIGLAGRGRSNGKG
jgi:DNA-binding GntR family transcriptional regulator